MDNLIALSFIHVLLPSFHGKFVDFGTGAASSPHNYLICFYNDKMESNSSSARGFSIGLMKNVSG